MAVKTRRVVFPKITSAAVMAEKFLKAWLRQKWKIQTCEIPRYYMRVSCDLMEPSLYWKPNNSYDTCGEFKPLEENSG